MKRKKSKLTDAALGEIANAYSDCHSVPEFRGERNLNFKASVPVHGNTFVAIAKSYIGEYNAFDASIAQKLVDIFGSEQEYTVGREGSPCVYIRITKGRVWLDSMDALMDALKVDEFSLEADGTLRLWWD